MTSEKDDTIVDGELADEFEDDLDADMEAWRKAELVTYADDAAWAELSGEAAADNGQGGLDEDFIPDPLKQCKVFGLNGAMYPRMAVWARVVLHGGCEPQATMGTSYKLMATSWWTGNMYSASHEVPLRYLDVALDLLAQARAAYARTRP